MLFHHLSRNTTPQHNTPHLFSHHSRTQGSNTISLNQSISINTQVLCNKYTKTQSYMQCDTMSVKNLVEHTGVHDKTKHILVSQVTLTR